MISGTFDQGIQHSEKFGGVRRVFEEQPKIAYGGFHFNMDDLPTAGQVLPAGAPVFCDEEKRTITPIYTIKVKSVKEAVVTVEKDTWGIPLKVGMVVGTTGETITKIEDGKDVYNVTFSAAPAAATEGAVLTIFPASVGKEGVKANAVLYADVCLDPNSKWANGDGIWFGIMLERRTFPYTDDIKKQLLDARCFVKFSSRK